MKSAFEYALDSVYEKEQKIKRQKERKENSKKALKEREQFRKKLAQFSKEDYDFIGWALHLAKCEVEERRGFNPGEESRFNRLMYQCAANGKVPQTVNIYNLNTEDVIKEVETEIQYEKEESQ